MKIDVSLNGLQDFKDRMERFPVATRKAASISINKTANRARTLSSREIRSQVRLTAAYLNAPDRLYVSSYATEENLSASITARKRPTSLVTYGAKQETRRGKRKPKVNAGISVAVKNKGARRRIRQAFFVRLKNNNLGVAVRSTEGLNLKRINVSAGKASAGIITLYGPSVDQVFNTVRSDIAPEMSKFLNKEFNRNYARLIK